MRRCSFTCLLGLSSLLALGCEADPPSGRFVSTCDPSATLDFQEAGVVLVNVNFCEGYAEREVAYEQDGNVISMRHPTNETADPVLFEINSSDALTLQDEGWNVTCGNCEAGDTWEREE